MSIKPQSFRISILLLSTSTFFFWTALYLYVPVLPIYAQHLGANLPMVGLIISSYAIAQLVLRIPIGLLSSALGKQKPLAASGIIAVILGAVGLGLASVPWLLFLARAFTGIGAATWVTFTVFFASYYPRSEATRAIGIISFSNGMALVVATSLGGAVAQLWGFKAVFLGAALLGIMALVTLLPTREPIQLEKPTLTWKSFIKLASHPLLITVALMALLYQFAIFAGIFGFMPVYATKIGATRAELGIITMIGLSSAALASLTVVYLTNRWGYPTIIFVGSALMSIGLLATPFIETVYLLEVIQVFNGTGRGLLGTTLMALSIRDIPPVQRATAMGIFQAIYAIGMLLGPLTSGFLGTSLGLASIFYVSGSLCLLIGAMAYLPILARQLRATKQ